MVGGVVDNVIRQREEPPPDHWSLGRLQRKAIREGVGT